MRINYLFTPISQLNYNSALLMNSPQEGEGGKGEKIQATRVKTSEEDPHKKDCLCCPDLSSITKENPDKKKDSRFQFLFGGGVDS